MVSKPVARLDIGTESVQRRSNVIRHRSSLRAEVRQRTLPTHHPYCRIMARSLMRNECLAEMHDDLAQLPPLVLQQFGAARFDEECAHDFDLIA